MQIYKKWVSMFFAIILGVFLLMAFLVYVMDPLQYFRPTTFYQPNYSYARRLAIPGIIRNHPFDTLIVGSSMMQNSKPSEVEQLFGGQCIKLAVPGASGRDLSLFIEESTKHNKVKRVIYGVDFFSFAGEPLRFRREQPLHLYEGLNLKNAYLYFYDAYIIKKILTKTNWATVFDSKEYVFDHDRFSSFADRKVASYDNAVKSFFDGNFRASFITDDFPDQSKKSFVYNVSRIARENPETEFHLFLSPYSILNWIGYDESGDLEKILEFRLFIAEECDRFGNMNLFDFQFNKTITHDLEHYYDISHYDQSINSWIINAIHSDKYRTDLEKCKFANTEIIKQIDIFKKDTLASISKHKSN
jgi:hypothetical protein